MLLRKANGELHFLDFREKAPKAATRNMYLDSQGNVVPNASLIGYKAAGVPGSVAGLVYAELHWGMEFCRYSLLRHKRSLVLEAS